MIGDVPVWVLIPVAVMVRMATLGGGGGVLPPLEDDPPQAASASKERVTVKRMGPPWRRSRRSSDADVLLRIQPAAGFLAVYFKIPIQFVT
jgi:hypothetical protein